MSIQKIINSQRVSFIGAKWLGLAIIFMLLLTNLIIIFSDSSINNDQSIVIAEPEQPIGPTRGSRSLGFTENSTGLSSSGDYNFIAFGDFNNDNDIDIASGGEDYSFANTLGLVAYTGNGGASWSSASTGLWTGNSWGGLALEDTDEDGYTELFATDERWGSDNNSGLKAFEYRSGSWTDSTTYVSTPLSSGRPDNVVVTNVTGDSRPDIVVSNSSGSGLAYYENTGGNPATWQVKSNGLATSSEFTAIAVGDMNKDGLKDIVALDYSGGEHMYIQRTTGALWAEYSTGLTVSGTQLGVAIGDVNIDGHMDIIYGGHGNGIKCLLGNSGGSSGGTSFLWTTANTGLTTGGRYSQIQVVDIDLDSDLDIIAPEAASNSIGIQIYLGNGSTNPGMNLGWSLAANTNLITTGYWYGSNCYDINGDGSLDIVAASWGNGIKCYLNNLSSSIDLTPPGAVTDLAVTNVTTNSITVNWSAPADNGTDALSGPVQSYDIRYSTSTITLGNWDFIQNATGEPTPASPGIEQSLKINGLAQGTQYYLALRSLDERPNISPLSNIAINSTIGVVDNTRPGQIKGLKAINPTNNSINLTWTAPADNGTQVSSGSVIEYQIKIHSAQITNATWDSATIVSQTITPQAPGGTETYTVTGLQAETLYYFAVKARDERPNWGWISNFDFNTTLPDPDITPPNAVTNLAAIEPTDTTINLTWTAPGDDGDSGKATYYDIRYSTSDITDLNWASATEIINELAPNSTSTIEHYQVIGLTPETNYYFALKVGDETPLWSGLSNIAFNTTLSSMDALPPGQITDLAASNPTSSSVKLTWTAPGDDGNSGTVAGYDIRFYTASITNLLWDVATQCPDGPTPVAVGNDQEYTVTGLLSEQKYYFAVKAFDEFPNYSTLSNIVNETTLSSNDQSPPGAINDLAAAAESENSIKLTWTAPSDDQASESVTGYDIRYSVNQITTADWEDATTVTDEPQPQAPGTSESFSVTGLFAGTGYYFAIKSFDEKPNLSPLSNIADAATYSSDDSTPPAKIDDLAVAETTETTITLKWTAVGDDGESGTATVYDIRHEKSLITPATWPFTFKLTELPTPKAAGENETYLVTGLLPATDYYFALKAGDEVPKWSPLSNVVSGTTKGKSIPKLNATFTPEKTQMESEETIKLAIMVISEETKEPISQAAVNFSSTHLGFSITPQSSLTNPNGEANVFLKAPIVNIKSWATIFADISKSGFQSLRGEVTLTIVPELVEDPKFNLKITQERITLSLSSIKESDTVIITANITNIGPDDTTGFSVKIFIDGSQIGTATPISILRNGDYITIDEPWVATEGTHIIRVEISPNDANYETDATDNSAEKSFIVEKKVIVDDGDPKEDRGDDNFLFMLITIIMIVVIVVILVAVLLMKKKRKEEASQPAAIDSEPRATPAYDVAQPPMEGAMETQSPLTPEPTDSMTEQMITAEYEAMAQPTTSMEIGTEPQDEYTGEIVPTEQPFEEPIATSPQEQMEQEIQEDQVTGTSESEATIEEPVPEGTLAPEETAPTREPEPAAQPDEHEVEQQMQQFPCPVCQTVIPFYSNPCPSCGNELAWE
jgi:hypothetical protein